MRTRVKICGITTLADARYCAGAGVDYLGFIQHPPSPRYISPAGAAEIIGWLYGITSVGVFVDATPAEIHAAAAKAGFTMIQLSGDESVDHCRQIDLPVIKTLHVRPDTTPDALRRQMEAFQPHVSAFLLDTAKAGLRGGTGQAFDWNVAAELSASFNLFVAGGLHAGNVREVIQRVHPFGIDLSSGVEFAPGIKDFDKLADLFETLDGINASSST
ncbi:MAG: phosphoribosylanthranilate isomerase [Rhodothermales bacterium]|nr:phosphoribosylanthranilate isomerase [Rhodothermales bacterium]